MRMRYVVMILLSVAAVSVAAVVLTDVGGFSTEEKRMKMCAASSPIYLFLCGASALYPVLSVITFAIATFSVQTFSASAE